MEMSADGIQCAEDLAERALGGERRAFDELIQSQLDRLDKTPSNVLFDQAKGGRPKSSRRPRGMTLNFDEASAMDMRYGQPISWAQPRIGAQDSRSEPGTASG